MTIDPMTDFFNNQSPYAMANNNPIANVDYYGLGIINWLGAAWRSLKRGIKNIGCGSCDPSREDFGKAWRDPDFGWYKSHKGSSTKYGNSKRPRGGVRPVATAPVGLASLGGASISSPELPRIVPTPPQITPPKTRRPPIKIKEEEEEAVPDIGVQHFNIPFIGGYTDIDGTEASSVKILSDLIKTLKAYPQMKVIVDGQVGVSHWKVKPKSLNDRAQVNGGEGPLEWLSGGRANAIIKLLKKNGVNANQLIKGGGIIGDKSSVVIKQAN